MCIMFLVCKEIVWMVWEVRRCGGVTMCTQLAMWTTGEYLTLIKSICAILVKYCKLFVICELFSHDFYRFWSIICKIPVSPSCLWQTSCHNLLFSLLLITTMFTLVSVNHLSVNTTRRLIRADCKSPKVCRNYHVLTWIGRRWSTELFSRHF